MHDDRESPDPEEFLKLLHRHEKSLAAYAHALVPCASDAEDLLQTSKIALWRHFGSFEPGTNFLAWARKVVLHQVLNHRRKEKTRRRYFEDEAFIESVAWELDRTTSDADRRTEALQLCLRKLPENHRRLILLRYYDELGIDEIADLTRRTSGAVYRLLSRVRGSLSQCIRRTMETLPA